MILILKMLAVGWAFYAGGLFGETVGRRFAVRRIRQKHAAADFGRAVWPWRLIGYVAASVGSAAAMIAFAF